jgi:hypothetical protein
MATVKCGAYTRPQTFKPPGASAGLDAFYKAEAWQFWASAEAVKLEVGNWIANAQAILSAPAYTYFYEKFQKMRADFDVEWPKVKGYSDRATFWCKYIGRGMEWDTQFKLLRTELKSAIDTAEASVRLENKKAGTEAAKEQAQKENTAAKKRERRESTSNAVETAGGNTNVAAANLAQGGQTAGSVGGMSPLDIALWIGGGVVALGILWTFLPESKGGTPPAVATAGLGRFGRRRRR